MATQFPAPPVRTPFPDKQWTANGGKIRVDESGYPSWGWIKWFQEIAAAFNTGTGTGLVTSVFGRSGDVVAVSGDYSVNQVTGAAPLNSPTFTGVPAGPTAAPGTNTTQLATTAFVIANAGAAPVTSVFGRIGAVVAQTGDYSFSQISGIIAPSQFVNGSANLTAQVANVSATTLLATGTSAGLYMITIYLVVSQAASTSSTLPDSRIIFTDQDSSAVITTAVTSSLTTNTTSTFAQASFFVNAKAATNIQFDIGQVNAYASVGGTPMQFAYRARAVYLG
jgi:hypothetical protein